MLLNYVYAREMVFFFYALVLLASWHHAQKEGLNALERVHNSVIWFAFSSSYDFPSIQ